MGGAVKCYRSVKCENANVSQWPHSSKASTSGHLPAQTLLRVVIQPAQFSLGIISTPVKVTLAF